ncbi:MAG: hypothetical protein Q8O15_07250, partial [Rectinemataceae bacterium]|nr:hypothetical protein [Rectinemataceae bacterium]
QEALDTAIDISYESTPARVMRAEYLVAIALQTGRAKDRGRVELLRTEASLDMSMLLDILRRFRLQGVWESWTRQ